MIAVGLGYAAGLLMNRPENIERQQEKESGSVGIKLKRHLVIECRLIKCIGDNFWVIAIDDPYYIIRPWTVGNMEMDCFYDIGGKKKLRRQKATSIILHKK